MSLFSIFKKNKNTNSASDNEFIDIETSIYETKAEQNNFTDNVNYKNLVYTPLKKDVETYKANRTNIGIVVDREQFGYDLNEFNSNITTYELTKNGDEEKIPFDSKHVEESPDNNISLEELKPDVDMEASVLNEQDNYTVNSIEEKSNSEDNNVDKKKKFSFFGFKKTKNKEKNMANLSIKKNRLR